MQLAQSLLPAPPAPDMGSDPTALLHRISQEPPTRHTALLSALPDGGLLGANAEGPSSSSAQTSSAGSGPHPLPDWHVRQFGSKGRAGIQCGHTEPSGRPASSDVAEDGRGPCPALAGTPLRGPKSESGRSPPLGQPSPGSQPSAGSIELQELCARVERCGQSRETWQCHRDKGSHGSSKERPSWDQVSLWCLAGAGHFLRVVMPWPLGWLSANASQPLVGHNEGRLFQPTVYDLRGDAA